MAELPNTLIHFIQTRPASNETLVTTTRFNKCPGAHHTLHYMCCMGKYNEPTQMKIDELPGNLEKDRWANKT